MVKSEKNWQTCGDGCGEKAQLKGKGYEKGIWKPTTQ